MNKKTLNLSIIFFLCLIQAATPIVAKGFYAIKAVSTGKPEEEFSLDSEYSIDDVVGNNEKLFWIISSQGITCRSDIAVKLSKKLNTEFNSEIESFIKQTDGDIAKALQAYIVSLDKCFYNYFFNAESRCMKKRGNLLAQGCTLSLVYIRDDALYCANLGNNHAFLFGKNGIIPLSQNHTFKEPSERKRIEVAGGEIVSEGIQAKNPASSSIEWIRDVQRQVFQVSRAIGNFMPGFKNIDVLENNPVGAEEFYNHPISNVPDVTVVKLDPSIHEFVVIGSVGLWQKKKVVEVGTAMKQLFVNKKLSNKNIEEWIEQFHNSSGKTCSSLVVVPVGDEDTLKSAWNNDACSTVLKADKFVPGYVAAEEQSEGPKVQPADLNMQKSLLKLIENDSKKSNKSSLKKVGTLVFASVGLGSLLHWHREKISKWWKNRTKKNKDK